MMLCFTTGTSMSIKNAQEESQLTCHAVSRREILVSVASAIAFSPFGTAASATTNNYGTGTSSYQISAGKESTLASFMPQIRDGYRALVDLQTNWEKNTQDFDGDVVRRVLGTVGVKSPLFNIKKAFAGAWKTMQMADMDVDLLEAVETDYQDVLNKISQVDFQLYSVNFTELRPTKQKLVEDGKATLDDLILQYKDLLDRLEKISSEAAVA